MNPQARFVKTDKGQDEIKNRTHKLEARTRQLLVMVDGGKAASDLLQTAKSFFVCVSTPFALSISITALSAAVNVR